MSEIPEVPLDAKELSNALRSLATISEKHDGFENLSRSQMLMVTNAVKIVIPQLFALTQRFANDLGIDLEDGE